MFEFDFLPEGQYADADDKPLYRVKRMPLITSTIAGTITKTKAVFNWAVRKKLLTERPLDGVGRGSYVNKEKKRHITMDEYRRLLDASPYQDWRVIIALARYGGLRCPSKKRKRPEVLKLPTLAVICSPLRFSASAQKYRKNVSDRTRSTAFLQAFFTIFSLFPAVFPATPFQPSIRAVFFCAGSPKDREYGKK